MVEIRCKGCGRLLGYFEGSGRIKCQRAGCGAVNEFDTASMQHTPTEKKAVSMRNRTTSSGVTLC